MKFLSLLWTIWAWICAITLITVMVLGVIMMFTMWAVKGYQFCIEQGLVPTLRVGAALAISLLFIGGLVTWCKKQYENGMS